MWTGRHDEANSLFVFSRTRLKMSGDIHLLPPTCLHDIQRDDFIFTFTIFQMLTQSLHLHMYLTLRHSHCVKYNKIVQDSRVKAQLIRQFVEIKCQLDATEVFIAVLIGCSTCFGHHYAHHQELKSIIQWLQPVVFRAVVFK